MEKITKAGRIFYGVAMAGVGIHQLFYGDFCNFLFPPWPNPIPGYSILAYLFSIALIIASTAIIAGYHARVIALILGGVLFSMLLFGYVPFEFFVNPNKKIHLGLWVLPLKELALVGGAFCIAAVLPNNNENGLSKPTVISLLEKFIVFGPAFFSTTMICFGICHFCYTPAISEMIPSWIPLHYFWTYFAGVALIGGGAAVGTGIWRRPAAILMGIMILLWFIFLHIPNVVASPLLEKGDKITSAFSALAFSGIAFVIGGGYKKMNK